LLITQICFAQWYTQNSDTTIWLTSVYFIDANTGWAVGADNLNGESLILKTTDGGNTWIRKTSETLNPLYSVYFADSNTGWAVGLGISFYMSLILKTTDGGNNWVRTGRRSTIFIVSLLYRQQYRLGCRNRFSRRNCT